MKNVSSMHVELHSDIELVPTDALNAAGKPKAHN